MPTVKFEDWETKQLNDPEFQAAAREQEPAYQVARLRILRGLTQGNSPNGLALSNRAANEFAADNNKRA